MPTPTANYSFQLPTPGGDDDVWGDLLNANWTALDTQLFSGTIGADTTGNADTATLATDATTLATPRDFTIGATARSFDGSANVTWSLGDIGIVLADKPTAEAGTNNTEFMTPLRTAEAIAALTPPVAQLTQGQAEDSSSTVFGTVSGQRLAQAFDAREQQVGVGQAWVGFAIPAQRNHSTVYQNTTGRPIQWSLSCGGGVRQVQASPDGSNFVSFGHTSSDRLIAYQLIIPDGWFYRINGSTGSITWAELR